MNIESTVEVSLIEETSFQESDRFYQYLRHVLKPTYDVNIHREDETKFVINFENKRDMRSYVFLLMADRHDQRLEFQDIDHLMFEISMKVNNIDESFVFYDNKTVANALDILTRSLDQQITRIDDIVKFMNDQGISTYGSFRTLVLDTLVNHNMIQKSVTHLDNVTKH